MRREIRDYYRNPNVWVTAEDIRLFCLPLYLRLEQLAQSQRLWLRTVKIVAEAKRKENSEALRGMPDISTFFVQRRPRSDPDD